MFGPKIYTFKLRCSVHVKTIHVFCESEFQAWAQAAIAVCCLRYTAQGIELVESRDPLPGEDISKTISTHTYERTQK